MTDYTYNTGNPIGSTDVRDGVDNLKSFDVLLNSTDDTYQDRLGNTAPTAAGAIKALGPVVATWIFTTGGTLNYPNEAALNPADGNYYGWTGAFPHVVAPGADPTLSGSGYVPRTDVLLREQLPYVIYSANGNADAAGVLAASVAAVAANKMLAIDGIANVESATTIAAPIFDTKQQMFTDASKVTITHGYTRPEWFGNAAGNIELAVEALPATGGVVRLQNAVYPPSYTQYNVKYLSKKNVNIVGELLPSAKSDLSGLENGTIINGPFHVFADGFQIDLVGFDSGITVSNTLFAGADIEGFIFFKPGQAPFSSVPPAKNVHIGNIIAICKKTHPGHTVLLEAMDESFIDNVRSYYGYHGIVLKTLRTQVGKLYSRGAQGEGVIVKSDSYAEVGRSHVESIIVEPETHGVADAGVGLLVQAASAGLSRLTVGAVQALNKAGAAVAFDSQLETTDCHIDSIQSTRCQSGLQMLGASQNRRLTVGAMDVTNGAYGVLDQRVGMADNSVVIDSLTTIGVATVTYTANDSQLSIGEARVSGVTDYINYYGSSGGDVRFNRLVIEEGLTGFEYSNREPTLLNGWTNFAAGNSQFTLRSASGKYQLSGMLRGGATNGTVCSALPFRVRPSVALRFAATGFDGAAYKPAEVVIGPNGEVIVSNYTEFSAINSYVSLDGVEW